MSRTIGILAALATLLDGASILARLGDMDLGWVALALAVSVVQVAGSAWPQYGMGVASNQGPGDDGEYDELCGYVILRELC